MLTRESLQRALELGPFLLPEIPGQVTSPPVPGVRGRVIPISHPLANIVGAAVFAESSVDAKVSQLIEYFAANGTPFRWRVGPATRPALLGEALSRAGMIRGDSLAGMLRAPLDVIDPVTATVVVRRARGEDADDIERIVRDAYPAPSVLASIFTRAFLIHTNEPEPAVEVHVACEPASGRPVAFGCSHYFADQPVMALTAAATLPAFRGRGAYTALVAHRLREAERRGVSAVVVQAVRHTSASILARMGFTHFCDIDSYVHDAGGHF